MITGMDNASGRRLRKTWRRLIDAAARPPLILMYHRIAQDAQDPWNLCVSPANFAEQMQIVRRRHKPMRLSDLTSQLKQGRCPRAAVVVTFDDGYRDNLLTALPVLEAHDVPATIFCTAGFIGRDESFWWDRLASLVLRPDCLPPTLALGVGGEQLHKTLGNAAGYSAAERAADRGKEHDDNVASPRLCFYREVWAWLRPLAEPDRALALKSIADWSAGAGGQLDDAPAALSRDQVSRLAASALIEIGAHSVTHAALPALPPAQQRDEIGRSKAQLEQIVGRPVLHFAYPFGDQSPETAALVREAGFDSSCTTACGVVRARTDLFHLPRIGVGDWDGDRFAKSLRDIL